MTVSFPEFRRYRTPEYLLLIALLAVVASISFPLSWIASAVAGFVALCLFVPLLAIDLGNARMRNAWLRTFNHRVTPGELHTLAAADPARYLVHVRLYSSFGFNRLHPLALVEDARTAQLLALWPVPSNVIEIAEAAGLQVVRH